MLHYIIDGNNLIGKIKSIHKIQIANKQGSREKLIFLLDRYFSNKKANITVHLDGFIKIPIKPDRVKIIYSDKLTADEKIKKQIEMISSRKNIVVITSDSNLAEYARICSCKIITSEEFVASLQNMNYQDDEAARVKAIDNVDEFKKLFGAKG
jgi:predicted RNA-binding protein with PIN domain